MRSILSRRDNNLVELMDDPSGDRQWIERTYRALEIINHTARWRTIYRNWIRPRLSPSLTLRLLDIGAGGGDVAANLKSWANRDGFSLEVTALDPDPRALEFARHYRKHTGVIFRHGTAEEVLSANENFDIVISNNVLHHLSENELTSMLSVAQALARKLVLFNDVERSYLPYVVTRLFPSWFYRDSFIHHDGPVSVRRSYRANELRTLIPPDWAVQRMFPARLLLIWERNSIVRR